MKKNKSKAKQMSIKRYKDELNETIEKKCRIKLEYEYLYISGLLDEKIKILERKIEELEGLSD